MLEFRVGDWVTVSDGACFTTDKKYEVFKNEYGNLYLVDDDGYTHSAVLSAPKIFKVKKTTPPDKSPPEEITAHGRTYKLQPLPPHEWKFGQWARHERCGVVFVYGATNSHVFAARKTGSYTQYSPQELTYICDAEIPK